MAPIAERHALEEEFDGMSKVVSWGGLHVGSTTSSESEPMVEKYRCASRPHMDLAAWVAYLCATADVSCQKVWC